MSEITLQEYLKQYEKEQEKKFLDAGYVYDKSCTREELHEICQFMGWSMSDLMDNMAEAE
jgi:hypothetical protein